MATIFTVGVEVQASAAQAAIARLERAFDGFARSSQSATNATQRFDQELDDATKQIDRFADEMEVANRRQQEFERGNLAVAVALGGVAIKAKQYISAIIGVGQATQQAIAANSTLAKDAKAVDKAFRQLTKELNYTTNSLELNQAAYDVFSAGVTETTDVLNVMRAGVAGAKGGFSDLATVTDAVTTIMNSFGKKSSEAQKIVDMMITTQNDGKIVAAQYGQQIGVVASAAATAGVKLEELNAAVALATVSGVQVSSTFSGLRQAISSVASPSEQAKKMAKELGIEFSQQAIKSKGFAQVLTDVATATRGNAEQIAKLFDSVEARAVIDPILSNLDRYNQMLANQSQVAGTAEAAQQKLAGGLQQSQAAFANVRKEVEIDIFRTIEPAVTAVTNAATAMAKSFVELPGPIQKVAIGIAALGGALVVTTAAMAAFQAMGITTAAVMGGLSAAMGIILSPIGLVVIAVGGLYLAFQQMMDSSEELRKVMTESMDKMGKAIEKIFNSIGRVVDVLTGKYAEHETKSKSIFTKMGDFFARYVRDTVAGWEMIANAVERTAIAMERRAGVGTMKGLSMTEVSNKIQAGNVGSGLATMLQLTMESRKLEEEIKKMEAEAKRFRSSGMGIPNVQLEEEIKKRKEDLAEMRAAYDRLNASIDSYNKKINEPNTTPGQSTPGAAPPPPGAAGEDEDARRERLKREKELAEEQLRQEKAIADRRRQEFEERQRRERDGFQDRQRFEGLTFDQRNNYETRLFDLQTRHQEILREQRLETESEIANAVINNQRKIEDFQRQMERRRMERQFQQEQMARDIQALAQQRMFEQAQANAANVFNQGQMVSAGAAMQSGGGAQAALSGILAYVGSTGRGSGPHLDLRGFTGGDRRNRIPPQRLKEIAEMFTAGGKPISAYPITSGYGPRRAPVPGASTFHPGFDYGIPEGTPLRFNGQAVNMKQRPNTTGGGGNVLEITLATGEIVQLLHLQKFGDALVKAMPAQAAPKPASGGITAANSKGAAIIQAARALGINPVDLATIIEFESDGVTHKKGGAGGNYQGLIQFGRNERQKYGYRPDMSFEEMVTGPVVRYFQDRFRGVDMSTQGADLETLYTTVLAGNPKANRNARDAFGTSPASGVRKMTAPGADRDIALRKYFTGGSGAGGGVAAGGGGMVPYAQAGVPGVTVTDLQIQGKLNALQFEQSIALRESALEQEQLTQLIREQANIVPQMMKERVAGLNDEIKGIRVQSDLLRLQGEEKKDYLAKLEFESIFLNEKLNLEKAIANASSDAERLALQEARNKLLKEEAEIVTAITVKYAAMDQLEAQQKQTAWAEKQIDSLKSMRFGFSAMSEQAQMAARMADNMGNTFGDAFSRFVTGAGSAQEAFAGFMSGMANVFAQELQRMAATAIANNVLPGLMGLFGGGAPSLFGGAFGGGGFSVGNVTGVASGISLPGFTVPAFADGGIVTKPMMGLVGEAGREAIIPLDKLDGMGNNVTINVSVSNDGSVTTDQQNASQLGRELESAVVAVLQKQKRPGGLLASVR
jgi:TP901 family phage tail tape measure protein